MTIKIKKSMSYRHCYFSLDEDLRKVFDENNKELNITGNTFRVLLFLCKNKCGTISQIGAFLDWAKDYDEDNLRQYRYKLENIIGYKIIEYKNGVYSLIGVVEKIDKLDINYRNTVLLHNDKVLFGKNNFMNELFNQKIKLYPALIASIVLLFSFLKLPSYGYYSLIKIIVTFIMAYYAFFLYRAKIEKSQDYWFWGFIVILILFNPFLPVYLYDKSIWVFVDILVIIFLLSFAIKFKNKKTL